MKALSLSQSKTSTLTLPLLIAMLAMVIDHVGVIFFPEIILFRYIGRLTFPIMAYQLVMGYYHTQSMFYYYNRLWLFGLLSQIGYTLAFDTLDFNTLFTLLLGLYLLHSIDKKRWEWVGFLTVLVVVSHRFDYGMFGIVLPTLIHLMLTHVPKRWQIYFLMWVYVLWNGLFVFLGDLPLYQLIGVIGLPIYHFYHKVKLIDMPRYFFYLFYGWHLLGLFLLYGFLYF